MAENPRRRAGRDPCGLLPPTGAHGASFAGWRAALPAGTALALVAPPGRGSRMDEEPVTGMAAYADAVAAGLRTAARGRRLVLVGVSLGALLAYETCRRLLDADVPVARLCVVAGQTPGDFHGDGGELTADDARAFVLRTGLTDPELLADPDFEDVLLPRSSPTCACPAATTAGTRPRCPCGCGRCGPPTTSTSAPGRGEVGRLDHPRLRRDRRRGRSLRPPGGARGGRRRLPGRARPHGR
ncbi:hypothetical protein BLA24_03780, partial [Streptomyces cinnamoneus]